MKSNLEGHDERVLILFYKHGLARLADTACRITECMECVLSPKGLSTIVQRHGQNYMANDQKFHGLFEKRILCVQC